MNRVANLAAAGTVLARDLPLIAVCGLAGITGYQLLLNAGERVVPAGTMVPARHRIFPGAVDSHAPCEPLPVSIDVSEIALA
jgi:hypothetical protein